MSADPANENQVIDGAAPTISLCINHYFACMKRQCQFEESNCHKNKRKSVYSQDRHLLILAIPVLQLTVICKYNNFAFDGSKMCLRCYLIPKCVVNTCFINNQNLTIASRLLWLTLPLAVAQYLVKRGQNERPVSRKCPSIK